jgi:ankyrin repeat protein
MLHQAIALRRRGAEVPVPETGWSLLHTAARFGQSSMMAFLLKTCRVPIDGCEFDRQRTPLMVAAEHGRLAECVWLATRGANLGAHDPHGMTALHLAMLQDYPDIAIALIEEGADPMARPLGAEPAIELGNERTRAQVRHALAARSTGS